MTPTGRGCSLFPMLGALVVLLLALVAGVATAQFDDATRQIRAAHILISPNSDPQAAMTLDPADPAWDAAEVIADKVAAELRAITDPTARAARFAELAAAISNDPGSGSQGGDLGPFTRDMMVPEFADPLFDAVDPQVGDIIGPVRSAFGWHVILYQGDVAPGASPAPSDPAATPAPTPGVTLLDPGAEPRVVLRYAPAAGSTATITMIMTSDQTVTIESIDPIHTTSTLTMVWGATVDEVRADGTISTSMTLTDVTIDGLEGLPAASADAIRSQLAGMVGLTRVTVSDATGKETLSALGLLADVDPQLRQVFEQAIAGFAQAPATLVTDPVGVGAHWSAVAAMPATDISTTSTSLLDVTITAIDGTAVTSHTIATSTADAGPVSYPGLPAGASVWLEGGSGTSEATTTMDLATLTMQSSTRSTSTTRLLIEVSGQAIPMTTESVTEMTITAE